MDDLLLDELFLFDFSFHTKDEAKFYHGFKVNEEFQIVSNIGEVFNFEFVFIESPKLEGKFLLISYRLDFDPGENLFSILVDYARGLNAIIYEEDYTNIFLTCKKFKFKNKSVTGLIGELGFIYYKLLQRDTYIIGMWHSDPFDIFDFYNSDIIYEVKTTKSILRKHIINHSQLKKLIQAEANRKAYLVSFQLLGSSRNHTLANLIELIENILDNNELLIFKNKLEFYSDLYGSSYKFCIDELIRSIKFYRPSVLPRLNFDVNYVDEENLNYTVILENLDDELLH
jgi:hypothetical protein